MDERELWGLADEDEAVWYEIRAKGLEGCRWEFVVATGYAGRPPAVPPKGLWEE